MESRRLVGLLALLALAPLGCARSEAATTPEQRGDVREVEGAVQRSAECAAELDVAAERDPAAVAAALRMEPIRLAPHGGPAVAPVRAEIAERLWDARADAAAAAALARCDDAPGAAANAGRRAARSLASSAELCRAAELLRGDARARARSAAARR